MTMQISTSQFYDRAATSIASTSAKTDTINTQIASGKKLQAPSDDSVAYQRLAGLSRTTADATSYDANLTMAGSLLQQADTTLTAITTSRTTNAATITIIHSRTRLRRAGGP